MEEKLKFESHITPQYENTIKTRALRRALLAAILVNFYAVVLGLMEAYSSPATVDMQKPGSRFIEITPNQITWIASLPVLGGGVGAFVSGYTSQIFGRRETLLLLSPFFVLSWLMIAYAPVISFIYAGRLLCGLFSGVLNVIVPAYATEISPVSIRGLIGTINHLAYSVGSFIMILLAYGLRWSWLAVSGATFVTLSAFLMLFLPESPEWLLQKSRKTEAVQSLRLLHGNHIDLDRELESLSYLHIDTQSDSKFHWRQFLEPTLYKPLFISLSMVFFSKLSGISIIIAYSVQIFQNIGSVIDPQSSAVLLSAVFILGNIVGSLLVDRAGRRTLYIISGAFLSISMGMLGLYNFLEQKGYNLSSWHWVPLLSLFMFMSFYSLGIGPMLMIMAPEMVPIATRSTVLALVVVFSTVVSFTLTKLFHLMVVHLQYYGMFWFFGVCLIFATLFGIFVLPETKGRSIDEINNSFRRT